MAIVKDLENAQQTQEKEVYQEENFLQPVLSTLAKITKAHTSGSGNKNYAPLEQRAEEFYDEVKAKGLSQDSSDFMDKYKKFRSDAFAMGQNYTPSEVDSFFKDYFGDEFIKPTKALIEADTKKQIGIDEEAMMIGAEQAPDAAPSIQAALGRRLYASQSNSAMLEKLLPTMSKEEREAALSGNYRAALIDTTNLAFKSFLDSNGGIATQQLVSAFKSDWTARLKMAGFPGASAQLFVDNAMSMWSAVADKHSNDLDKLAKSTDDVKKVFENQLKMASYSAPITYKDNVTGKEIKTTHGALLASLGVTSLSDAPAWVANHIDVLNQLTQDPTTIEFAQLPNDFKDVIMTRQGSYRIKNSFEPGSAGRKAIQKAQEGIGAEYGKSLNNMSREDLAKATNYNTAANLYTTTFKDLPVEDTTPEEQKNNFNVYSEQAGSAYDTFLKGNGFILVDKAGDPHYITYDVNDKSFVDSTNAGQHIEFMDNDAVDARTKVFGAVRQMLATASKFMPTQDAIAIWNDNQVRTSSVVRNLNLKDMLSEKMGNAQAATAAMAAGTVASSVTGVDFLNAAAEPIMTDEKVREIVTNFNNGNFQPERVGINLSSVKPDHRYQVPVKSAKYSTYNAKDGTIVFTARMNSPVLSPVTGVLTNASGNPFSGVYSVEIKEDATGNLWRIAGTSMENGIKKANSHVSVGDKVGILKGAKPALGVSIKDSNGAMLDPRPFFAAPVPSTKPTDLKEPVVSAPKKAEEAVQPIEDNDMKMSFATEEDRTKARTLFNTGLQAGELQATIKMPAQVNSFAPNATKEDLEKVVKDWSNVFHDPLMGPKYALEYEQYVLDNWYNIGEEEIKKSLSPIMITSINEHLKRGMLKVPDKMSKKDIAKSLMQNE